MPNNRIEQLYAKCLDGSASSTEREELLYWLALPENEQLAKEWMLAAIYQNDQSLSADEQRSESMLQAIFQAEEAGQAATAVVPLATRRARSRWLPYAAAVMLLLAGATYFWLNRQTAEKKDAMPVAATQKDILPGHQGAVLTLAGGRHLVLDSLRDGIIAHQHGAAVSLQNGQLSYSASNEQTVAFNTITTPRGRKYDIQLSDGTHIWLNAASSVTYPTAFKGKTRNIQIKGEAYLEVAKDKLHPFIVNIDGNTSLEVLGTSFNVKAYDDESSAHITLLEGSVKVSNPHNQQLLQPGQQVQVNQQGRFAFLKKVDTEEVIAWKNGIFNFKNADIQTVMRELARWYDIEVVYNGAIPARRFQGEIGRDLTLSQVLKGLKSLELNFAIEGKKIYVTQ